MLVHQKNAWVGIAMLQERAVDPALSFLFCTAMPSDRDPPPSLVLQGGGRGELQIRATYWPLEQMGGHAEARLGAVIVTLLGCDDLSVRDYAVQSSDPYVTFTINKQTKTSAVIYNCLDPKWIDAKFDWFKASLKLCAVGLRLLEGHSCLAATHALYLGSLHGGVLRYQHPPGAEDASDACPGRTFPLVKCPFYCLLCTLPSDPAPPSSSPLSSTGASPPDPQG